MKCIGDVFGGCYKISIAGLFLLSAADGAAQSFSLQSSSGFPVAQFHGRHVAADFDADGDTDVLFQTGGDGTSFSYARNNGDGSFAIVAQASSPFAGLALPNVSSLGLYRTADFDADGDIDIWVPANSSTGTYFRNDGASFSQQSSAGFPTTLFNGRNIVDDFDGDGDADILFQTGGDGTAFSYARNNGNAGFTIVAQASSPFAGLTLPNAGTFGLYRTADFDGDGDIDVWVPANSSTGTYFRNDGASFSSQSSASFPAAQFQGRNVVGDFDADGDADILYQTGGDGTAFSYARSNGNGSFTIVPQASSPFAGLSLPNITSLGQARVGDFDGDGDLDKWVPVGAATGVYFAQNDQPPAIISSIPANNAPAVAVSSNITLAFNEAVTKNTGNIYLVEVSTNTVAETIPVASGQVTGSGTTWVIDPSITLLPMATYVVRIDAETFVDLTGAVFAGLADTEFQFTTGVPVPLVWLYVGAVAADDLVHIRWTTADEQQTADFSIERSTDGISFMPIGQTPSANSPGEHNYSYNDRSVLPGYTYYYRLKQVDIDGAFKYSSVMKVVMRGNKRAVLVLRNNPVQSDIMIAVTLPEAQPLQVRVMNPAGMTVLETSSRLPAGETMMKVDGSRLSRGTYYLLIIAGREKLQTIIVKL
jgi:methionine-rich copper-binding protein CopC